MYLLIGYLLYLTFTIGLLFWILLMRTTLKGKIKKQLSIILGVVVFVLSIVFMTFIPFSIINIFFYVIVLISYAIVFAIVYRCVRFFYTRAYRSKESKKRKTTKQQRQQPVTKQQTKSRVEKTPKNKAHVEKPAPVKRRR